MKSSYEDFWRRSLGPINADSGKLYVYRRIKSSFGYEKYLTLIKKFKCRRALSSLRISAHRLEVETGRWVKKRKW